MVSRITLLVLAAVGIVIALDENSVIFQIVSFAWAGFGATFGPLMLFSLFWKRINKPGAIAGMLSGAGMVFLWKHLHCCSILVNKGTIQRNRRRF